MTHLAPFRLYQIEKPHQERRTSDGYLGTTCDHEVKYVQEERNK